MKELSARAKEDHPELAQKYDRLKDKREEELTELERIVVQAMLWLATFIEENPDAKR